MLSPGELCALPKVVLHGHLDDGLRPTTMIEHCAENGHELPTADPEKLGRWFSESVDPGSLVCYLEGFAHATVTMQTRDRFVRVACEFVLDQAASGVVYAEACRAPEQRLEEGLTPGAVMEVVHDGLTESMAQAEAAGRAIAATRIVTAMCRVDGSTTGIVELALACHNDSVVGYDITGVEIGSRPTRFQASFDLLQRNNARFMIHADEADGPKSMWETIQFCGIQRIGHGVRVYEDIEDLWGDRSGLGRFVAFVRDQQTLLKVCSTSNLQTGVAKPPDWRSVRWLTEFGFNITTHYNNRLMSGTSLLEEFVKLSEIFGRRLAEVEAMTAAVMRAVFLYHDERETLVGELVRPAFYAVRREARA